MLLQWWLGLVGIEHRQPDQQQAFKRKVWGGVGKKGRGDQRGQAVKGGGTGAQVSSRLLSGELEGEGRSGMAGNEQGGIIASRLLNKRKVEGLALVIVTWHGFSTSPISRVLTAFDCKVVNKLLLPEASSLRLLPCSCDMASTVPGAFPHPTPPRRVPVCRSANALLELPRASGSLQAGTVVSALLIDDLQGMPAPDQVPPTPGFF